MPTVITPMTATQKLLAFRAGLPSVRAGDMVSVPVTWEIASELALNGMLVTHAKLGNPRLANPDRFYLSVDHTLSPHRRLQDQDKKGKALAEMAQRFTDEQRLRFFDPANRSILHTRPYEEFFLPGDVVMGADSHTTMHGGLGTFSVGLGGADVMMAGILGRVLLRIPEMIRINIEGKLPLFLEGKDLVLALLKQFGRNTIAFERIVEYGGSGLAHLTASDRGTIANMGAEMGGMAVFFEPDEVIARFIAARRSEFNQGGLYFRADPNAPYAETYNFTIDRDLSPMVALEPGPEVVQSVTELEGRPFTHAFIGSCTTTPLAFVHAAFMAKAVLACLRNDGWGPTPPASDRSRVLVPSSMGIFEMLKSFDLLQPFRDLGFTIPEGAGCSMCLGIDGDGAPSGATVLGTHNRTFLNRTGRGAHSMAASAATVTASANSMTVADPRKYEAWFDREGYNRVVSALSGAGLSVPDIQLTEPQAESAAETDGEIFILGDLKLPRKIRSKVVRFEEPNIDTDRMIAGAFCHLSGEKEIGRHAFQFHRRTDGQEFGEDGFRRFVEDEGHGVVVAGEGWGSGSSREHAAWALVGSGVQVVIAKSIAFIHLRNLVNEALPFRLVHPDEQERFYGAIQEGDEVEVDLANNTLKVFKGDSSKTRLSFRLQPIHPVEEAIYQLGGLAEAYKKFGVKTHQAIMALAEKNATG